MADGDHLDQVLATLGYGRWQAPVILLSLAVHATLPVHQLGSTLLSSPVDFRCLHTHGPQAGSSLRNRSGDAGLPEYPSLCLDPLDAPQPAAPPAPVSEISLLQYSTGLPSCPVVEYDTSVFVSTVVSEWHLVCERTSWRTLFPIMYPVGSIIGSILAGYLSDSIGRKRASLVAAVVVVPATVGVALVPWFPAVLALKVLSHMAVILFFYPTYSLAAETTPPVHRGKTLIFLALGFFVAMLGLGGVATYVTSWRLLWLATNTPLLIAVPVTLLVDESPRWLAQQGRGAEVAAILERAARLHGVTLDNKGYIEKLQLMSPSVGGAGKRWSWVSSAVRYIKSPAMRIILLLLPLHWTFLRMLYVGIILSANNFTGNSPFEYIMTSGGVGCVSLLVVTPVMAWLGRRTLICSSLLVGTICLLAEIGVPSELWVLKWILVMTSFCLVVAAFQVNYAYAAELLPTVIRTRGFTLCNVVGCLGEAAVPLITEIIAPQAWWAASVCFGAAGLVGSLLITFLPETKDKPMPDTLDDVEERHRPSQTSIP